VPLAEREPTGNTLVVGTVDELEAAGAVISEAQYRKLGEEGFLIRSHRAGSDNWIVIAGNSGPSVLTGTFHFLRLLQTHQDIRALDLSSCPRIRHRVLSHWDNLDGSIERGYAGRSLWKWDELPTSIDPRYHDYARACASIGINGACLNNVNAQAKSLTADYLAKAGCAGRRVPALWHSCVPFASFLRADPARRPGDERPRGTQPSPSGGREK